MPLICLCICTYKRDQALKTLLETINGMDFSDLSPYQLSIIIINNLAEATPLFEAISQTPYSIPTTFYHQPIRGISSARNLAIEKAFEQNADLVAFLDDDETPAPNWLSALVTALETHQADIVSGVVKTVYPDDTKEFLLKGGFHDRQYPPDGSIIKNCASGNLLIKAHVFKAIGTFDIQFELLGGGDTDFSTRATTAGFKIVQCNQSIAYEPLVASRQHFSWLIKRYFRSGGANTKISLKQNPSFIKKVYLFLFLILKLFLSPLLPLVRQQPCYFHRMLLYTASSVGGILQFFNIEYLEYQHQNTVTQ